MNKIHALKMLILFLTLLAISAAGGEVGPIRAGDDPLILYRLDGIPGRYLLSMTFEAPDKAKVSFVVIGDTFSVRPRGAMCDVVMSNVYILQTRFNRTSSNEVVQTKFRTDAYKWLFPINTKLAFNDSVIELRNVKLEASAGAKSNISEGKDALRQLRRSGLGLPDDIDIEKAVGSQKQ